MPSRFAQRPVPDEYFDYYEAYVGKVPPGSIIETLRAQAVSTAALLAGIPADRESYRYAPGKWTIREVVCHMVDTEREFAFRVMRFARGDGGPLSAFDQDRIMAGADLSHRPLTSLATEFAGLRASNIALFESFEADVLDRTGIASGYRFTVRSLLFIIAGHERHHVEVLAERYI